MYSTVLIAARALLWSCFNEGANAMCWLSPTRTICNTISARMQQIVSSRASSPTAGKGRFEQYYSTANDGLDIELTSYGHRSCASSLAKELRPSLQRNREAHRCGILCFDWCGAHEAVSPQIYEQDRFSDACSQSFSTLSEARRVAFETGVIDEAGYQHLGSVNQRGNSAKHDHFGQ